MKVSSFFWNVRGLGNHKTVEMLISLLKLHKTLLIFLAELMMLYTDASDVLFKSINMHLVATSPIVNSILDEFGCFNLKSARTFFLEPRVQCGCGKFIWCSSILPSKTLVISKVFHGRLPRSTY